MKKNKASLIAAFTLMSFSAIKASGNDTQNSLKNPLLLDSTKEGNKESLIKTHKEGCSPHSDGYTIEGGKTLEPSFPQGDSERIKENGNIPQENM